MEDDGLLATLDAAAAAVGRALAGLDDWGPSGRRPGQYRLDLAADGAALDVLHRAGLGVLSEESGRTGNPEGPLVVLDPVDGSTNAFHGVPFYATSLCVLDGDGPRVSLVLNQATGARYHAIRGGGAFRDDGPITPSGQAELSQALVGISGFPARSLGWAQFRALGAASLEFCAVAEGVLDAYVQLGQARLFGWDYLGGLLLSEEAGAVCVDLHDEDLAVRDDAVRRPFVAATGALLEHLLERARRP